MPRMFKAVIIEPPIAKHSHITLRCNSFCHSHGGCYTYNVAQLIIAWSCDSRRGFVHSLRVPEAGELPVLTGITQSSKVKK